MNLILFEAPFKQLKLSANDPRTCHILTVLKIELGGIFYIGFINSERALAKIESIYEDGAILLSIVKNISSPPCLPIDLLIGMPRPHTAKRILYEGACFGVRKMHFFQSDHTEPSYMRSRLWQDGDYRERLVLGAEQSFTTHLPEVFVHSNLEKALSKIDTATENRINIVLDNYEAKHSLGFSLKKSLSDQRIEMSHIYLALGSERGFSSSERALLINNDWELAHLGNRVLRLEMAVVSVIAITSEVMNLWHGGTDSFI